MKKKALKFICGLLGAVAMVCVMATNENILLQVAWTFSWLGVLVGTSAIALKYNLLEDNTDGDGE